MKNLHKIETPSKIKLKMNYGHMDQDGFHFVDYNALAERMKFLNQQLLGFQTDIVKVNNTITTEFYYEEK